QVGADDYMVKPFEIGELMLRIRKMIDNRLEIGKGFLSTDDKEYSTVQDNRFKRIHKGRDEIILAIDDNPINLEVVKTRLEMNNWKVEVAEGGKDGLLKYKSLRPNLILLDIMMPEVDGYEVCRMIREEYKDKMIPIIFLTAKKEQEDKIYGINVGGDDYVTKPFDKDDLVIRVSQHLKNREMMQEVKEKKLLEYDMELAGEIQKKLIPKVFPKDKAIDFFGGSQAAKGVGGDYFDIIDIGNGKYLCVVVDVMGKGMSAALVMVKIETLLKSFSHKSEIDLKEIIRKINQNIYKDLEGDRYASMFLMVYDSISHKIEYINAGHEPLLIYDHKTGKIKELMSKLYALGINEAYDEIDVSTAVLNPKDVFIMYTDGINEAMNKDRKQFGKERVRKMLSKYNDMNIMTIYKSFMDEVAEYTKGVAQHDDITLVIGKVK
ncbi:MAG: SpoIIE family protein phosphatase, partial [Spirochaetes bacterium]|nr:SpoIIE family protein phosphatase [Spirochaetota bacterium]